MLKVRTIKTGSGSTAVQVVTRYRNRTQIIKHIGSARYPEDVSNLSKLTHQYIRSTDPTKPLFKEFFQERKTHNVRSSSVSVKNSKRTNSKLAKSFNNSHMAASNRP